MSQSNAQPSILWFQLIGLSLVQGAITLTWLLYRLYVPQLLTTFGFPGLFPTILVIENALGVIIEPLAGNFSDCQRQWMGTRFPFISLGVILASGLFIAIPSFYIFGQSLNSLHWIFPILLILWAVAMALFRSPVTALLGQYAIETKLPQAMSILIFIGGIVGAIRPISSEFILSLGSGVTFTVGSLVLLGSVAVLRYFNPDLSVIPQSEQPHQELYLKNLVFIASLGLFGAWGTRFILGEIFPQVIKNSGGNVKWMMFTGLILLAFASIPAGLIAVKIGNTKATLIGLIATSILLIPLSFFSHSILFLFLLFLIASYSLVANGIIPIAFSLVPPHKAGLGIGVYFAAFSLAMSGYDFIVKQPGTVNLFISSGLGIIAFLMIAILINFIPKLTTSTSTS
ncbi:MFS transporter [Planktothrix sp. FACHB-1365]|uniref:MFS transporter n=1 Tax=Planktothrix sp. FACHB-1365 TaxID=2692855 RepID=UPI001687314A|nr:MFS transporter [Planktothrix sp. FACHB-1365]MBD2484539.1 MFS transporter [Planktothrix sp. FACHB-1365]